MLMLAFSLAHPERFTWRAFCAKIDAEIGFVDCPLPGGTMQAHTTLTQRLEDLTAQFGVKESTPTVPMQALRLLLTSAVSSFCDAIVDSSHSHHMK